MMKKGFMLFLLLGFISCVKQNAVDKVEQADITQNEVFEYSLGNHPSEGNISILKQAKHFEKSEISQDIVHGIIYTYVPSLGFIGEDSITILYTYSIGNDSFQRYILRIEISVKEQ